MKIPTIMSLRIVLICIFVCIHVTSGDIYWEKVTPKSKEIPSPREGASLVAIDDNKLILYGGKCGNETFSDLWVYDVTLNEWSEPNIIDSQDNGPGGRAYHVASVLDIYGEFRMVMFGGESNGVMQDSLIYSLDISDPQWAWDTKEMPEENHELLWRSRTAHSRISSDSVLVSGGYRDESTCSSSSYAVMFENNEWHVNFVTMSNQSLIGTRAYHYAGVIEGEGETATIAIVGGKGMKDKDCNEILSSTVLLEPHSPTVAENYDYLASIGPPLSKAIYGMGGMVVDSIEKGIEKKKLFIFGGKSDSSYEREVYEMSKNNDGNWKWEHLVAGGPSPSASFGNAITSIGSRIFFVGGMGDSGYNSDIHVLHTNISTIIPCPQMCNGHGYCDMSSGVCHCNEEYKGVDCSGKSGITCPHGCFAPHNGHCNTEMGVCDCYSGYEGEDCSVPTEKGSLVFYVFFTVILLAIGILAILYVKKKWHIFMSRRPLYERLKGEDVGGVRVVPHEELGALSGEKMEFNVGGDM